MYGRRNHSLFIALLVGVSVTVFWFSFAQLEIVSEAHGIIVPATKSALIQHLEGGIIANIHVREGHRVEKGDQIISLESIASDAEVEEIEGLIAGLQIDLIRLEAEVTKDATLNFPEDLVKDYPLLISRSKERFVVRKERLKSQLLAQGELVKQRYAEREEIKVRLRNNIDSLGYLDEQVGISASLLEEKITNRMNHLQLLKERSMLVGRVDEDEATLVRIRHAITESEFRITAIENNYKEDVRRELDEKVQSHSTLIEREQERKDSLSRTVIRSPVTGIVQSMRYTSVGGVVAPGAVVAEVIPVGDKFLVEASLPWQDIGYVNPGQDVNISLAFSESYRFGKLTGKVLTLSPDTIEEAGDIPHYKIMIEVKENQFSRLGNTYLLVPGIQVICGVVIGRRSVFDYIFEPFMSSWQNSLSEK